MAHNQNHNIFIDQETLLDVIDKSRPLHRSSSQLFLVYAEDTRSRLFTSSDIIKSVLAVLYEKHSKASVLEFVTKLFVNVHILEYGHAEIKAAATLFAKGTAPSFQIALDYIILKNASCHIIISGERFYYEMNNLKVVNPAKLIDRY